MPCRRSGLYYDYLVILNINNGEYERNQSDFYKIKLYTLDPARIYILSFNMGQFNLECMYEILFCNKMCTKLNF